MVLLLCYSLSQDQLTILLCFFTHQVSNCYLCPVQYLVTFNCYHQRVQDQVMMHQYIPFLQSLLVPTSSLLLEPHRSECLSRDKLQKSEIILTLKVLFSSSSASPSLYFMSYLSLKLQNSLILLMLSSLVLILFLSLIHI